MSSEVYIDIKQNELKYFLLFTVVVVGLDVRFLLEIHLELGETSLVVLGRCFHRFLVLLEREREGGSCRRRRRRKEKEEEREGKRKKKKKKKKRWN